jgi:hypothetical protein
MDVCVVGMNVWQLPELCLRRGRHITAKIPLVLLLKTLKRPFAEALKSRSYRDAHGSSRSYRDDHGYRDALNPLTCESGTGRIKEKAFAPIISQANSPEITARFILRRFAYSSSNPIT